MFISSLLIPDPKCAKNYQLLDIRLETFDWIATRITVPSQNMLQLSHLLDSSYHTVPLELPSNMFLVGHVGILHSPYASACL